MNTKRNNPDKTFSLQLLFKWLALVIMTVSVMGLPSLASADESEAGKVIFVFGQAWKHSPDGGKHDLKRGMAVHVGETIETSANGQVQIRMNDNGLIAIRPGSQFKIQAFKFSGSEGAGSSDDKSYFQLLKGGFRSITGAVGQRNKKAYKVETPVATIGIRGTDYTARICSGDCQQDNGLYLGVWQGGVSLTNEGGVADIDAGQYGYVPSAAASPVPVESLPADLLAASNAPAASESVQVASSDNSLGNEPLTQLEPTPETFISPLISLPKSGTATYTLSSISGTHYVGGTATTDTLSGSADLNADFTNQTVDANVNISVSDGGNWGASVPGMSLNMDGSFAYTGGAGSGTSTNYLSETGTNGGGTISGQLTGMGDGTVPTGATMDLQMWDTFATTGDERIEAQITLQ